MENKKDLGVVDFPKPKNIGVERWKKALASLEPGEKPCKYQLQGVCKVSMNASDKSVGCAPCKAYNAEANQKSKQKKEGKAKAGMTRCRGQYEGCLEFVKVGGKNKFCEACQPKKKKLTKETRRRMKEKKQKNLSGPDKKICNGDRAGCKGEVKMEDGYYCEVCGPLIRATQKAMRAKRAKMILANGNKVCTLQYKKVCDGDFEPYGRNNCRPCVEKQKAYMTGKKERLAKTLLPDQKHCSRYKCYNVLQKSNPAKMCDDCRRKSREAFQKLSGLPSLDPVEIFFWRRRKYIQESEKADIQIEANRIADEMIIRFLDIPEWALAHIYVGVGSIRAGQTYTKRKAARSAYDHFEQGSPTANLKALALAEIILYYKLLKLRGKRDNMWNSRGQLGNFPIFNKSGLGVIYLGWHSINRPFQQKVNKLSFFATRRETNPINIKQCLLQFQEQHSKELRGLNFEEIRGKGEELGNSAANQLNGIIGDKKVARMYIGAGSIQPWMKKTHRLDQHGKDWDIKEGFTSTESMLEAAIGEIYLGFGMIRKYGSAVINWTSKLGQMSNRGLDRTFQVYALVKIEKNEQDVEQEEEELELEEEELEQEEIDIDTKDWELLEEEEFIEKAVEFIEHNPEKMDTIFGDEDDEELDDDMMEAMETDEMEDDEENDDYEMGESSNSKH